MTAAAPEPVVVRETLRVGGRSRTCTVLGARHAPPGRAAVIVLHGSKQTGDAHRRFTGRALDALAADGRAVVAYLDGYRGNWNDARRDSRFPARRAGVDDVAFVTAVRALLQRDWGADPHATVLVGYSNGGQMVFRLLHEVPDLVDAAVVVAATMPADGSFLAPVPAPAPRPVPIVLVHGTRDRIARFAGGPVPRLTRLLFGVGGVQRSAEDTAAYFAARSGLTGAPVETLLPHRGTSATRVRRLARRGDHGRRVDLFIVDGGGHTVPGPVPAPRLVGRTGDDVTLLGIVEDLLGVLQPAP